MRWNFFDQLTDKEAAECVWMTLKEATKAKNFHNQCGLSIDMIIKSSMIRKTLDNVTAVMIAFSNFENYFNNSQITINKQHFNSLENKQIPIDKNIDSSLKGNDNYLSNNTSSNKPNTSSISNISKQNKSKERAVESKEKDKSSRNKKVIENNSAQNNSKFTTINYNSNGNYNTNINNNVNSTNNNKVKKSNKISNTTNYHKTNSEVSLDFILNENKVFSKKLKIDLIDDQNGKSHNNSLHFNEYKSKLLHDYNFSFPSTTKDNQKQKYY